MRDLPRLGRTYPGLGIAYQERGDIGKAIEYTHRALALYALEDDSALQAYGQNELGLLLMRQGQMERADDAFRAALAHFGQSGTEKTKSHVLLSLGELKMRTGRPADGIQVVKEAIDLAKRLGAAPPLPPRHPPLAHLYQPIANHP